MYRQKDASLWNFSHTVNGGGKASLFRRGSIRQFENDKYRLIEEKVKLKIKIRELRIELKKFYPGIAGEDAARQPTLEEIKKVLEDKIREFQSESEYLKNELATAQKRIASQKTDFSSASREIEELKTKFSVSEKSGLSADEKLKEVRSRLAAALKDKRHQKGLAKQIEKLENKLNESEKKIKTESEKSASSAREMEELKLKLSVSEKSGLLSDEELKSARSRLAAALKDKRRQKGLAKQIEKLESKLNESKKIKTESEKTSPDEGPPAAGLLEIIRGKEEELKNTKQELLYKKEELETKEKAWREVYEKKDRELKNMRERRPPQDEAGLQKELDNVRDQLEEANKKWGLKYGEKNEELLKAKEEIKKIDDAARQEMLEFTKNKDSALSELSEKDKEIRNIKKDYEQKIKELLSEIRETNINRDIREFEKAKAFGNDEAAFKTKIKELNGRIQELNATWRDKYRKKIDEFSMPAALAGSVRKEESRKGDALLSGDGIVSVVKGFIGKVRRHLAVISASVQFIGDNISEPEKAAAHLDNITAHIRQINKSRMYVIDYYRGLSFKPKKISTKTFLNNFTPLMEKLFAEKGINLSKISHGESAELDADSDLMSEACLKLIENAVEAMNRGDAFEFETDIGEKGKYFIMRFTDSGQGIEARNLPHIFEPFFSTRKNHIGTGLSLVHRIIDAHKGRIEIKSARGKGAVVSLYIPVAGNTQLTL